MAVTHESETQCWAGNAVLDDTLTEPSLARDDPMKLVKEAPSIDIEYDPEVGPFWTAELDNIGRLKEKEEVKEPSCRPTLRTTVCTFLIAEDTLDIIDVSETHMVTILAVERKDELRDVPCVPKKLPNTETETQPVAGEFVACNDETRGLI